MSSSPDLFTCPSEDVTADAVEDFVRSAISARLQAESLVLEFKAKNHEKNVVLAVAAMSNTDGGLVLVGVDEGSDDPLCGLTSRDVDGVVQQLRALLPDAVPEVIPVALPSKPDRAVLVLRVDADDVDHPIVVDGRVMVRCPGHSVGARRDEILELVNRQRRTSTTALLVPMDVAHTGTWGEDPPPVNELRVLARLWLPHHVEHRGVLSTHAFEAARGALMSSPVPSLIGSSHLREHEISASFWKAKETSSIRVVFECEPSRSADRGHHGYRAMVRMILNGRSLDTLMSIVPMPEGGAEPQLDVETLADMLISASYASISAGVAMASAIGAARPLSPALLDMWISGPLGPQTLELRRHWDAGDAYVRGYRPRPARPTGHDAVALLEVVKDWLTPLLLDLGATDFEDDIERLEVPRWSSSASST